MVHERGIEMFGALHRDLYVEATVSRSQLLLDVQRSLSEIAVFRETATLGQNIN